MRAVPAQTSAWLLGPRAEAPVVRLWDRYRSLALGSQKDGAPPAPSFRTFRLASLGVPERFFPLAKEAAPTLLTDAQALDAIEQRFRDAEGRSLQRLCTDDIASRVLVEASTRVPLASVWLAEAQGLLTRHVPRIARLLETMGMWVVPIYHEKYGRPFRRGFSHMNVLGTLFTSFVERSAQPADVRAAILAVDLAHELGHQVLMLYQHADPVLETPPDVPVYSPVRRVDRPAILALHAAVAAAFMMEACDALADADDVAEPARDYARSSLAELASQQRQGLASLGLRCRFGAFGRRLFGELEEQCRAFSARPLARAPGPLSYFGLSKP